MNETTIEKFWDAHPCGDHIVGGLTERFAGDYERFFTQYDAWRYDQEGHILECLDALHVDGKAVLEIGLGEGAEAEQLVRRGAHYSGLDLTSASIERVAARLRAAGPPLRGPEAGVGARDPVARRLVRPRLQPWRAPPHPRHREGPAGDPPRAEPRGRARGHALRPAVTELPGVHQVRCVAPHWRWPTRWPVPGSTAHGASSVSTSPTPSRRGWVATCDWATSCTAAPTDRSTPSPVCTTSTAWPPTSPTSRSRSRTSATCTRRRCPSPAGRWPASSAGTSGCTSVPLLICVALSASPASAALRRLLVAALHRACCRLPAAHCAALFFVAGLAGARPVLLIAALHRRASPHGGAVRRPRSVSNGPTADPARPKDAVWWSVPLVGCRGGRWASRSRSTTGRCRGSRGSW